MNPKCFSQCEEGQKGGKQGRKGRSSMTKASYKAAISLWSQTTLRKEFAQKCSYHRSGGLFEKECTRAGTYSVQSSICFSTRGCSLSPAHLQGRIWCHHLLLPLFSSAAWREGQGEEKTGMCHIATASFDFLCNFLCLGQVGRQSGSLTKHTQIILLATEQSHDSFVLSLPRINMNKFIPA